MRELNLGLACVIVQVKEMKVAGTKAYNPWVKFFAGYSRTWAEFPVFVMLLKAVFTLGVVWMFEAKFRCVYSH